MCTSTYVRADQHLWQTAEEACPSMGNLYAIVTHCRVALRGIAGNFYGDIFGHNKGHWVAGQEGLAA